MKKPEALISYIDKDPTNKDTVLKTIRNHWEYKDITKSIKSTDMRCKGKKKIVRQKTKRIIRDAAAGAALTAIVVAEIAIVPVLIILIL